MYSTKTRAVYEGDLLSSHVNEGVNEAHVRL